MDRLVQMSEAREPFGAQGPKARALLEQHGLTQQEESEVQVLCAQIFGPQTPNQLSRDVAQDERALELLWAWTMKWSVIARQAIQNKTLLRALGLEVSPRRTEATEGVLSTKVTIISTSSSDDFLQRPVLSSDNNNMKAGDHLLLQSNNRNDSKE